MSTNFNFLEAVNFVSRNPITLLEVQRAIEEDKPVFAEHLRNFAELTVQELSPLFVAAAEHGRSDVLELFFGNFSKEQCDEIVEADRYRAFRRALDHGRVNAFEFLSQKLSHEQRLVMIRANEDWAFRRAYVSGEAKDNQKPPMVGYSSIYFAFIAVAENNKDVGLLVRFARLINPEEIEGLSLVCLDRVTMPISDEEMLKKLKFLFSCFSQKELESRIEQIKGCFADSDSLTSFHESVRSNQALRAETGLGMPDLAFVALTLKNPKLPELIKNFSALGGTIVNAFNALTMLPSTVTDIMREYAAEDDLLKVEPKNDFLNAIILAALNDPKNREALGKNNLLSDSAINKIIAYAYGVVTTHLQQDFEREQEQKVEVKQEKPDHQASAVASPNPNPVPADSADTKKLLPESKREVAGKT
jgi:hypothetical protein